MEELWGGRFEDPTDPFFKDFSSSLSYDRRLLAHEIRGTKAWAFALARAGVLEATDATAIARSLRRLKKKVAEQPDWVLEFDDEDIHTFVQNRLKEDIGEPALRVHTGRSRNDQVATDVRLWVRQACSELRECLAALGWELTRFAESNIEAVLPGYTHLRRAQPVLVAHWALAYVEMLLRDAERLGQAAERANVLPLGAAALAGTGFRVDRERLARHLGFARVSENSLDVVSDRDFIVDVLSASALCGVHLSRLCEDLIVYSSAEFGFVEIGDDVSTGSSLMPQKKNPDSLELVRGKSGRLCGNLAGLLTTLKGLPMAYNRDLQEDKEPLFDTVDTLHGCLRVMQTVVAGLGLNAERCGEAAGGDFSTATDVADYLVRRGVPFRTAHSVVGQLVLKCIQKGETFASLKLADYRELSVTFNEDIYDAVKVEESLAARAVRGGTAPIVVTMALRRAQKRLTALRREQG